MGRWTVCLFALCVKMMFKSIIQFYPGEEIPGESTPTEDDIEIKGDHSNSNNTTTKNHNPADDPPRDLQVNLGGR